MKPKVDPGTWILLAIVVLTLLFLFSGLALAEDISDLKAENKILWYLVSAAIGGLGSYMVVYGKLSAINAKLEFLEKHHTENTGKIAKIEAFSVKTREDLNKFYRRVEALEESNHGGKL
jgi:hypothetical protein